MDLNLPIYALWLVGGFMLCAAETFVPGAFLIWIGAAAVLMGAAVFLWLVIFQSPMTLGEQLLLFAILIVALVALGRYAYGALERRAPSSPGNRADAMIGKSFFLETAIERGIGRIHVGDSVWRVAGPECAGGTKVRVTGIGEGGVLQVEPL